MPIQPGSYYCPQCGYDLRGQTVERCPECGFQYDKAALESMAREAFHTCIGPYLNAIAPLAWSAALSMIHVGTRISDRSPFGSLLVLFVPPVLLLTQALVRWAQDWILREAPGPYRPRGPSWTGLWAEDMAAIVRIALAAGGLIFLVLLWRGAIAVTGAALIGIGLWRTLAGASADKLPERLSMSTHRAQAIEWARAVCWTLVGVSVPLWLIVVLT